MGWLKLKEAGMKDGYIRKLMGYYKTYEELFCDENFKLFNTGLKTMLEKARNIDISKKMDLYYKNRIRIISANDREYPEKLKKIIDYPLFLYVKGKSLNEFINTDDRIRKNIAVVGTRRATKFGKSSCERIVKELLYYNVNLISGLAEGIDTIALTVAVEKEGNAVAVVGSGLDRVYPYENKILWEKISGNGILISEYPLGTEPLKWNFPKRNRIIAGLADGIIIAESFKSGGSLITAELGFSMDKEIFAIPGFINYPSFEGCNNLIKENKAKLITCAEDVAQEFLWDINKEKSKISKLNEEEKLLFCHLYEETGLEELMEKVKNKIPLNRILSILMSLKVKGLIIETGTAKYVRLI
ncbi:DNA-protecting protein DprA [Leptotrichia sp. OH3620_COT-345]|uniref:DNA-processing protein DprA n=1 Tax=Leptotrichia sp. OH3620_COT-345 TaxID=2491048 RepID=UPI000F651BD4|nr:DNA-processing protein DprA [Leptotrichia sp. OH3620_COT-345]RRD39043.1 DNA-protecting protein DprA [Leptotrichia sp. OH3620_COT-345]